LVLIGVTYLSDFISKAIESYRDPGKASALYLFNAAGLLVLSLAAAFVAVMRILSVEIESRKIVFLIFVAGGWGGFAPLMQIYPWNLVLLVGWVVIGLLICRKSQWDLGGQ